MFDEDQDFEDAPEDAARDIDLDEFEEALRRDVDAFFDKWRMNMEDDPDNWPEKMGQADWMEQFLCDISNG